MSEAKSSGMGDRLLNLTFKIFAAVVLFYLAVEIAKTLWISILILILAATLATLGVWWYRARRAF